jgi:hypothetical protein
LSVVFRMDPTPILAFNTFDPSEAHDLGLGLEARVRQRAKL